MAEQLTPQERLQPALLDRLTDDEPDKTQELREHRVMSKGAFARPCCATWRGSSTAPGSSAATAWRISHARRSVINFGLPAHAGETASTLEIEDIERDIKNAIIDFEPRILPESLVVKALVELGDLDRHNVIAVQIHGQLWAQPVPLELLVRTEIDLETGKVQISDLAPSRVS